MMRLVLAALLSVFSALPLSAQGVAILATAGKGGATEQGGSPVSISTTSPLATCVEGTNCSVTVTATGGSGVGYTLTKPTGSFPAGCSITSASNPMTIGCSPPTIGTSVGTANFTLLVTDSMAATSGNVSFEWTVGYGTPVITTSMLSAGVVGTSCSSTTLASQIGLSPRTYAIILGSLPAGCTFSGTTGAFSGAATEAGNFGLTFRVTDALGSSSTKELTLSISVAVSGSCTGMNPDDYLDCVKGFEGDSAGGGTLIANGWTLRSNAEIEQWGDLTNAASGFFYDGLGVVDAARGRIARFSYQIANSAQIDPEIGDPTSGDIVIMHDTYHTNSWRIGAMACTMTGKNYDQKSYMIQAPAEGNANRWAEFQDTAGGGGLEIPNPDFNGVLPLEVSSITALGTTATATTTNPHGLSNGDVVTVSGATNTATMTLTSITNATPPVVTTASAHNLTGSFLVRLTGIAGDTPAIGGTASFIATVTGADTFTVAGLTLSSGGTGGTATMYPYTGVDVTIGVAGNPSQFTYPINVANPSAATGSDIWVVKDPDVTFTGEHCYTAALRIYPKIGPSAPNNNAVTQDAVFNAPCNEWVRRWYAIEMNQGAAWTCGAVSGNYDLLHSYYASESQPGIRVHNSWPMEADEVKGIPPGGGSLVVINASQCATYTDIQKTRVGTLYNYNLRMNSSQGGCTGGASVARDMFIRHFAYVRSTVDSGAITFGATSINVNGTEILVQPVP